MKKYLSKRILLLTAMALLFSFIITSCEPDEPEPQRYLGKFYIGEMRNFTFDTVRVFLARATLSHPITNHPFYKNLYFRTNIEYYFAKNVGIIQLKITGFNFNTNADKTHNWNLKYYKIIN